MLKTIGNSPLFFSKLSKREFRLEKVSTFDITVWSWLHHLLSLAGDKKWKPNRKTNPLGGSAARLSEPGAGGPQILVVQLTVSQPGGLWITTLAPFRVIRPSYGSAASGHPTPWEQNAPLFLWMGLNFKQLTPFLWVQAADNTYIGSIFEFQSTQSTVRCGIWKLFISFWIVQFKFWMRLDLSID